MDTSGFAFAKPKDQMSQMRPAVRQTKDGRDICEDSKAGRAEYGHRRCHMVKRQKGRCALNLKGCCKWITFETATFDHEDGRGGGKRDDAIYKRDERGRIRRYNAAVCLGCNSLKGSRRIPYQYQ